MNTWHQIWEERGKHHPSDNPFEINGFDQKFGKIDDEIFREIYDEITTLLQLNRTDSILDLGCGSGVYVSKLSEEHQDIVGVDLSEQMIIKAKSLYPRNTFVQSDPRRLPFSNNSFDKVYCHSVFQYFDSDDYASQVLLEIIRVIKPGGGILISDIMDMSKKEEYSRFRAQFNASPPQWKSSINSEVTHRYYSKEFFIDFSVKNELKSCQIEDRNISGYQNSKYRFNVILKK